MASPNDIANIYNNYHFTSGIEYFQIPEVTRALLAKLIIMPTITKLDVEETFQLFHSDPSLLYFQIPKDEELFYVELTLERLGAFSGIGGGGANFISTFNDGDLVGNILSVAHNLSSPLVDVVVKNNLDQIIIPDGIVTVDNDNLDIDLTSFAPLTGLWYVFVNL